MIIPYLHKVDSIWLSSHPPFFLPWIGNVRMMNTTTSIISSSYKIPGVTFNKALEAIHHCIGFVLLSLTLEFFNQSGTRVNPITINSLDSLIKMFYEVSSFAYSLMSLFSSDYHLLLCYDSKFLLDTLVVLNLDKNSLHKLKRSCCRW